MAVSMSSLELRAFIIIIYYYYYALQHRWWKQEVMNDKKREVKYIDCVDGLKA